MSNIERHNHKFSTGDNIKSISKTQTIETKTTKLNVTIITITIPEVSKGYNIFLL